MYTHLDHMVCKQHTVLFWARHLSRLHMTFYEAETYVKYDDNTHIGGGFTTHRVLLKIFNK